MRARGSVVGSRELGCRWLGAEILARRAAFAALARCELNETLVAVSVGNRPTTETSPDWTIRTDVRYDALTNGATSRDATDGSA